MSTIHTLLGARPPLRLDGKPWTRVRIEHSADEDGTYSLDEIKELTPVDSNPAEPQKRDLTFSSVAAEAFFRLVFLDDNFNQSTPTEPVFDDGSGINRHASVRDVAALLRARTFDDAGQKEGEFSTTTRPTAGEVSELITRSYGEVSARLGQDVEEDSDLYGYMRNVVALRTAMAIELSYFPEQADEDRDTIYRELKALYEAGLMSLVEGLPDTSSTVKGIYSIPLRSDAWDIFSTSEVLP